MDVQRLSFGFQILFIPVFMRNCLIIDAVPHSVPVDREGKHDLKRTAGEVLQCVEIIIVST